MNDKLVIIVRGMPGPQGSKAFKGMRGGHAILVESSAKVKPWRQAVVAAAVEAMEAAGATMFDGPLTARMVFTLPKPTSAPKRRASYPDKKPDLSKLLRSTEDALSDAGVWRDDARVVEYSRASKVFPGEDIESLSSPGCRIEISRYEAPATAAL